ncbi:MAG: copper amine oxidase N-terminal domain-containing protein [Defluviitaleaceae bacterium]|nr:copper amine oxidase N-terminal domain-containing protein [Defluviitaleaceae bacterium]
MKHSKMRRSIALAVSFVMAFGVLAIFTPATVLADAASWQAVLDSGHFDVWAFGQDPTLTARADGIYVQRPGTGEHDSNAGMSFDLDALRALAGGNVYITVTGYLFGQGADAAHTELPWNRVMAMQSSAGTAESEVSTDDGSFSIEVPPSTANSRPSWAGGGGGQPMISSPALGSAGGDHGNYLITGIYVDGTHIFALLGLADANDNDNEATATEEENDNDNEVATTEEEAGNDNDNEEVVTPTPVEIVPISLPVQVATETVLRFTVGQTIFTRDGLPMLLNAAPFEEGGQIMVPLRQIGEAIDADFAFENNTAFMTAEGVDLELPIGVELPGGGAPVIVDSRTFVPHSFIANAIGAAARVDANVAYITIQLADAPLALPVPPIGFLPELPVVETPSPVVVATEEANDNDAVTPTVEEDDNDNDDPTPTEEEAVAVDWNDLIDLGYVSMHRANVSGGASYSVLPTGIRITGRGDSGQDGVAFNVPQIRAAFGNQDITITGILFGAYEWSAIGGRADGSMWTMGTNAEQSFTLSAGEAVASNLWNGDDNSYIVTVRGATHDIKITGITVGGEDIFALIANR